MRFKAAASQFLVIAVSLALAAISSPALARTIQLVGLGDSLMAGYQIGPNEAYPARLEAALKAQGIDISIANAGVSGDTTSAALLAWTGRCRTVPTV